MLTVLLSVQEAAARFGLRRLWVRSAMTWGLVRYEGKPKGRKPPLVYCCDVGALARTITAWGSFKRAMKAALGPRCIRCGARLHIVPSPDPQVCRMCYGWEHGTWLIQQPVREYDGKLH